MFGDITGGGHMFPGRPDKDIFPKSWGKEKIMHEISDILTDPKLKWIPQTGNGGYYTKANKPAKFIIEGIRDRINIKVVFKPAKREVVTAYPIGGLGVIKK